MTRPKTTKELLQGQGIGDFIRRIKEKGIVEDSEKRPSLIIPNATQVPNPIFDELLPVLSFSEFKVLMYLCRKTFGYNKIEGDYISLSQIMNGTKKRDGDVQDKGTGLGKTAIVQAISNLEKYNLVEVTRKNNGDGTKHINRYRVKTTYI